MATSSYDSDPPVDWYGSDRRDRSSRLSSSPSTSIFRSVLILINYFPAIEDIQNHQYTRVIDNALQEPAYGNPWLIRHVLFTIGETIRSNNLTRTTFEGVHETLVYQILARWQIRLPDDYFTLRFKDSDGQYHDIPRDANIYRMLEFHRAGWNRWQHAENIHESHLSRALPSPIFYVSLPTVPHNKKTLHSLVPSVLESFVTHLSHYLLKSPTSLHSAGVYHVQT